MDLLLAWRSVGRLVLRRDSIVLNGYQSSLSRIPPWNLFRTQYKDTASTADFISPKVTRPDTPHAKRETSMMHVLSTAATSAENDRIRTTETMRGRFKAHRQKSGLQKVQTVSESGICSLTLMQMRTIGSPRSVPLSSYSNLAIKDTLRFIASRVSKVVPPSMSDVKLGSKLPTRKTNRHRRSRGSMGPGEKGINIMVGLLMMFARDGILQTTEGVSRFNLELGKDSITALGFSQKPGSAYPTCLHFHISITSSITTFLSLQPRGSSLDLARIPQHR